MRCFNASILIFMYQHFENKARLNVNTENTSVALSVTKYFLPFLHKKNKILCFVSNNICISKERIDSNFLNNYRMTLFETIVKLIEMLEMTTDRNSCSACHLSYENFVNFVHQMLMSCVAKQKLDFL